MNEIAVACQQRGVKEVVHFTTDKGLLGTMSIGCLLSRQRLRKEQQLAYILKVNVDTRKDGAWLDYVNLSVGSINTRFFNVCSGQWHRGEVGLWWCILAFDPAIMTHQGVVFTTTNNFYHQHVVRRSGTEGFQSLFAPTVAGVYGQPIHRSTTHPSDLPTDPQAEVLYPQRLSLEYLRRACFMNEEHADYFETLCSTLHRRDLAGKAEVDPSAFRRVP